MNVRLIKRRSRRKKLPADKLRSVAQIEGDLEMIKYQTNTRSYSYAKMIRQYSRGLVEEVCHLYEPRLISIEGDSMLFDGVERINRQGRCTSSNGSVLLSDRLWAI
jgi:hypothetical protein